MLEEREMEEVKIFEVFKRSKESVTKKEYVCVFGSNV